MTLDLDPDGALLVVVDDGLGIRPRADTPGLGLGLSLIAEVCDNLDVVQRAGGTTAQMRFSFAAAKFNSEEAG